MKKTFNFTQDRKDKIKRFFVSLEAVFDSLNEKEKEEFLNEIFNLALIHTERSEASKKGLES